MNNKWIQNCIKCKHVQKKTMCRFSLSEFHSCLLMSHKIPLQREMHFPCLSHPLSLILLASSLHRGGCTPLLKNPNSLDTVFIFIGLIKFLVKIASSWCYENETQACRERVTKLPLCESYCFSAAEHCLLMFYSGICYRACIQLHVISL